MLVILLKKMTLMFLQINDMKRRWVCQLAAIRKHHRPRHSS